jgi:uncharacterized protein YggU (UPF0235/DUF167 family)
MYIHIKVTANARKESFEETKPSYFNISVREKAEGNMANRRVIELLQNHFKTKDVRIINGHQSPSKLISIGT